MDLVILDTNYQPSKLVENYDSLIWTERYNTTGDFQITTGLVDQFMTALPEGTVVSLRESNVPMIVETHKIDRKKNTPQVLTIKGRSFESILDRRVSLPAPSTWAKDWTIGAYTPAAVAYYATLQICVAGVADPLDVFPSDKVGFRFLDYPEGGGPTKQFTIPKGQLLDVVLTLLQTEAKEDRTTSPVTPEILQHGIRSIRPDTDGTAITIDFYLGEDKTSTVYFDGTRDMLDDGSYLFSKRGSANVAYFLGTSASGQMTDAATEPSGLDRRVILLDATQAGAIPNDTLRSQVAMSLSEAHETAIFDGSINQDLSPYTFGVDYNLGDIVRVVGDYGLDERARVTEYIRSEDNTGVKAYPTLTSLNDNVSGES